MKKPEYREGLEAKEKFEEAMKQIFRAPKKPVKSDNDASPTKKRKSDRS